MNIFRLIAKKIFTTKKTNMETEILSQPDIIFELIRKYIKKDYTINIEIPDNVKKVALVASGSSYHSATIAANFLRTNVHCEAQSYYASEVFLAENFDVDSETLYIFISQSGETLDTNKSLDLIKSKTSNTLAVTNTKNSSLYNNSNYKILTFAGLEKSIASTKAMSAQLFCLFLIALKIMQQKELPIYSQMDELLTVPDYIKNVFNRRREIKNCATVLSQYENAVVLASGMFYPLAKEGALKIKETSYINTSAYPTGEFLHGHIAILNKPCAVISFINNCNAQFTLEVLSRINNQYKANIMLVSSLEEGSTPLNNTISITTRSEIDFVFSALVVMQLIAFETAVLLGKNVDKPEGLSKIVK